MLIDLISIVTGLIVIAFVIKKLHKLYRIIRVRRILRKVFRDD